MLMARITGTHVRDLQERITARHTTGVMIQDLLLTRSAARWLRHPERNGECAVTCVACILISDFCPIAKPIEVKSKVVCIILIALSDCGRISSTVTARVVQVSIAPQGKASWSTRRITETSDGDRL